MSQSQNEHNLPPAVPRIGRSTEQQLAATERALRESEARLRAVFNQAAVGIAVAGLDGRFEQVNRRFEQIVGRDLTDLQSLTIVDITHPDDRAQTRANAERLLAGSIAEYAYEKRFVREDGSSVWALTTVTLLRDDAGQPRQFIGVVEDITERKRTEAALRSSEEFNRGIIESSRDCIKVLDLEGRLLMMASGGLKLLCIPDIEPYLNRSWTEFWGAEDRPAAAAAIRSAVESGSGHFAGQLRTMAGEERWWDVLITPILGADGRPEKLLAVSRDVTETRRQEEVQARLAAVVESSDDAIVSKTLEGIITTWNKGAERLFGYTAEETVGQHISILIPPDRLNEETEILAKLKRGERIEHYETLRRRKDGKLLDISLSISPIKNSSGKVIGASKIARDITLRRQMEEALRDESRVLEILNRTGALIGSQLDLQTLVQSVTDAGTELSGAQFGAFFYNVVGGHGESYQLYALTGAPREAFERFGLPRNTPLFKPTFRGEGVVRCGDVTQDPRYGRMEPHHGMPQGHLPVRSYLAVPVVSRSGEVIGGLFFGHPEPGLFTARTERIIVGVAAQAAVAIDNARLYDRVKQAAEEREHLLEAERTARAEAERVSLMKDEFLATLSHELRTPLNAILGWTQILRSRRHENEELTEALSIIDRNTRAQAQLIEDLLDMSRIISGKIRLDVQQIDLQDVVKAAVASVRHSADAKSIRLQVVLDPLAGPVRGDPARLQQCLWNLLSNAIKFTPKGGQVQVALERVNSHVEVCIADNGQGIKPEFLPHLFERFRQADSSITRRHGGLGLGLSIVKHLIELHGGKVRAKSPGEGQGSTFCIELPLMVVHPPADTFNREHPSAPPAMGAVFDQPSLEGITVLALDDEPDARNLIRRVLEDCGARVLVAASADEAFALLQAHRPDMIISDIGMPGEDGYQFIRKVRALSPEQGGRIPAAALTAFARAEDRTRALRAGYQTHVAKPVEHTELTAVVASLALRR